MISVSFLAALCLVGYLVIASIARPKGVNAASNPLTQGSLQIVDGDGKLRGLCPLKHTAVKAEISGFLARVTVTQEFTNPFEDKIEAVYAFPLPQNAAVDEMTMRVGDHTVRGKIKRREEARAVYEAARAAGQVASLLDTRQPAAFETGRWRLGTGY